MNEWEEYKISDIADVIGGGTPSTSNSSYWNGNIPWLTPRDLTGYSKIYISKGERNITSDGLRNSAAKLLPKGTVLLTSRAPIGYVAIAKNEISTNQGFKSLILKEDYANSEFVYYWIRSNIDYLQSIGTGTTFAEISGSVVKEISISLPSISLQKSIASILSSLDDKIDLLHRQNVTLEKMAETLFRQWFVEEAKEEWVRTKIGDVLDTVLGGTPSTKKPEYWDGNIPWINSGEVNNFRILQCSRFITELGLKKSNTKLLPVGTTVLAITGATLGQVSLLEIDTCANQSVVGIIPNGTLPKEFIFLWIKMKISEIILSETGGAQPHINKNDINETDIVIPDSDYLNKIKLTIEPLFKKITHNSFQIRTLTALRDTLLPKLMSGEVRVD